jgi:hypothetical protein
VVGIIYQSGKNGSHAFLLFSDSLTQKRGQPWEAEIISEFDVLPSDEYLNFS